MFRRRTVELLHQAGAGNSDRRVRLHEVREIVEVEVVRPEIRERVDAGNRIEEFRREGERVGIGMQWKHAVLDAGVAKALNVLRGAYPQIDGPNLHAEFAAQK